MNSLSKIKIRYLGFTPKRDNEHSRAFHMAVPRPSKSYQ